MDDMMSKLQEILGSEQGRQKLQALAGMLGAGQNGSASKTGESVPDPPAASDPLGDLLDGFLEEHGASPEAGDGGSGSGGFDLGGMDLGMLMKLGPMLSKLNTKKDDKNAQLIRAIKPHLKPERQQKADEAMRMMQLLDMLPLLKELDLFDSLLGK